MDQILEFFKIVLFYLIMKIALKNNQLTMKILKMRPNNRIQETKES